MTNQYQTEKFERAYRILIEAFRTPPRPASEYSGDGFYDRFAKRTSNPNSMAKVHPRDTSVSEKFFKRVVQAQT